VTTPSMTLATMTVTSRKPYETNWSRLEPGNEVRTIAEGLQARVRDPLFMLSQQFRSGEFRAHNGGTAVRAELTVSSTPLNVLAPIATPGPETHFDLQQPLESVVENEVERSDGVYGAPNWDSLRLAYRFGLSGDSTSLISTGYDGERLDWFDFNLESIGSLGTTRHFAVKPQAARFAGAPLSRWWSFEDGAVDLGGIERPQLDFLTPLLMEFALLYGNNWLAFPVRHDVGHLRRLDRLAVFDSFGVVTEATPVVDGTPEKRGWEVFTLASKSGANDGRLFFLPNNLYDALESEPVEDVSAVRDESANLYWLIENRYESSAGVSVNRRDEEAARRPDPAVPSRYWDVDTQQLVSAAEIVGDGEPGRRFVGPVALYEPRSFIPPYRIPYRTLHRNLRGEHVLRRSRTIADASTPQYRGRFAAESKFVYEEEIPRIGIRLTRSYQLARDAAERFYIWRSRRREADLEQPSSGLVFDRLIEAKLS
jgi:hypothetical protein